VVARHGPALGSVTALRKGRRVPNSKPSDNSARSGQRKTFQHQPWASVYVGRTCVDHVIGRGPRRVEAFDRHDRSVGILPYLAARSVRPGRQTGTTPTTNACGSGSPPAAPVCITFIGGN